MAAPSRKEALDAAVGKAALDGELLGQLHLHVVTLGEMEAAAHCLLVVHFGVEDGLHLAAGIHRGIQVRDDRGDQRLGQVIERRP